VSHGLSPSFRPEMRLKLRPPAYPQSRFSRNPHDDIHALAWKPEGCGARAASSACEYCGKLRPDRFILSNERKEASGLADFCGSGSEGAFRRVRCFIEDLFRFLLYNFRIGVIVTETFLKKSCNIWC